jgi:serine protease Do
MRRTAQWAVGVSCLAVGGIIGGYLAGPYLQGQNAANPLLAPPKEANSYRDVVKKVLPAVVSIETKVKAAARPKARRQLPDDIPEQFRRQFEGAEHFEMPEPAPQGGFGSGFLVDPKGVVLTNYHVVAGAESVEVSLSDGRKFTSKDIVLDAKTDLAVVRIEAKGALPFLEIGDSDQMEIGDHVLAAGAPFGLLGSVTHGIISAKGRNGLSMNMYEDFLQTDAPINPGNSGGPLLNLEGKVIGINSAIKTRSGGFQGVGLAIASNLAKNVMEQLLKDGVVRRGYLGVQIKDLEDRELAGRLGLKDGEHGVLVTQVFDKAPAGNAGVQAGDVIVSIGGKPVKDGRELQRVVAGLTLGKPAPLGIVRDGKPQTLQVTVEEQPQDFGSPRVNVPRSPRRDGGGVQLDKIGVDVTDLTPELAEQFGLKNQTGVVVTRVEPGSAAEEAGLRRGTLVLKVDKEAVKSAAGLRDLLDKAPLDKGVLLQTYTPQGGTGFTVLKAVPATK